MNYRKSQVSDKGVVAVLFAIICSVVIIPLIAFVIDLTRVQLTGNELQDDLTTAALVSAITYESGTFQKAQLAARVSMLSNGWTLGPSGVTDSSTSSQNNSCRVVRIEVSTEVPMIFAKVFGLNTFRLQRSAFGIFHDWAGNNNDCTFNVIGARPPRTFADGQVEVVNNR